ncbi:putative benzoate 4-monooxygenase cytochrome P450 [Aspergillus affinis]|uniref:putative benzoate 4-monooxygenase cytochrome P450 n=1 Tax=Aspergillus affinis TaxID=1070780 RepID=UPI0022FF4018|nr:putative benzoate 4-monooxygenase cytochrome P450 [Aspergillus affinis]KAI9042371.1 putative benzoate 4-monooxygenase cytochrome P450 [Aspergillus affinis]
MLNTIIALAPYGLHLLLLYAASVVVYRLYFHPLAHIPGPPLARLTYLFELYYDLGLKGQFTFHLRDLHHKYGPVIRINPDEIHVHDLDYFDHIYSQTNGRTDKPPHVAGVFGPYSATISTQSHSLHKIRRSAVSPFFSRKSVIDLAPAICRPVEILCERLREACDNRVLNMKYIFGAVTLDIINDYIFARDPFYIRQVDFGRKTFDDVDSFLKISLLDRVNKILNPAMTDILDFRVELSRQVEAIRSGQDTAYQHTDHRTIFHELLDSKLPASELKKDRLRDEAFSLMTTGSVTTAATLRATAYHVAANESIRRKLYDELCTAISDSSQPLSLAVLERLPYLAAVIDEGLRLYGPVTHRASIQLPDRLLKCHGYTIPANTTVGMTPYLLMRDKKIFTDPHLFNPERWITGRKKLDKYLIAFGRGSRMCLGMNLARAELLIILSAVFRQFTFDVTAVNQARDIDYNHDYIMGASAHDSPGILVKPTCLLFIATATEQSTVGFGDKEKQAVPDPEKQQAPPTASKITMSSEQAPQEPEMSSKLELQTMGASLVHDSGRVTLSGWRLKVLTTGKSDIRGKFDYPGFVLLLAASVLLIVAIEQAGLSYSWDSALVIILLVLAIILLVGFLVWEWYLSRRSSSRQSVFPWKFVKHRVLLGTCLTSLLSGVPYMTLVLGLPGRFQNLNNDSGLDAGVHILPFTLSIAIASASAGGLTARGRFPPIAVFAIGAALQVVGIALLYSVYPSSALPARIYGYQILAGVGVGLSLTTTFNIMPFIVDSKDLSVALGAVIQLRVLGGALGVSIAANLLNNTLRSQLSGELPPALIEHVLHDVFYSRTLSTSQQQLVQAAFADGYRKQLVMVLGFAAAQLLALVIMWEKPLRKLA